MKLFYLIFGGIVFTSLAIVVIFCVKKRELPLLPVAFVSLAIMILGVFLLDIAGGLLFGLLWTLAIFVIPAVLFEMDEEKALACIALLFIVLIPGFGIATGIMNNNNECKKIVASIDPTKCGDYYIAPTLYCSECLGECDVFVSNGIISWKSKCIHCGKGLRHHHTLQYTTAELQYQREIAEYNSRYDFMTMMPQ